MNIQSNGINAYSTTDQISHPPAEKLPAPPTELKSAEGIGFITDRTDLSAQALALSKSVQSAGISSEPGETRASEKGETKEEPTPSPSPQIQTNQQSSLSINIRV